MKKLLILSLAATLAMGQDSIKDDAKNVGEQYYEAIIKTPATAVKKAAVKTKDAAVSTGKAIKNGVKDAYETAINSEFVQDTKEAAQEIGEQWQEVATDVAQVAKDAAVVVKNAAIKTKDVTAEAVDAYVVKPAVKAKDATVKTAKKIAKSEAVADAKDVGQQFVNAPFEIAEDVAAGTKAFWARVIAATKAAKKELFA